MVRFNLWRISLRRLLVFLITPVAFAFIIWYLNGLSAGKHIWNNFYAESDINTFFCESTDMSLLIRQPVNTFSNFIFWLVGLIILRRGWKDQSKRNRYNIVCANPIYSIMLGGILLYIFCASTFFHASLIDVASHLDFSAVYSLSLFPLMFFTHRVWLLSSGRPSNIPHTKSTVILFVLFSLAYLLLTFFLPPGVGNYVVLAIIITIIIFGIIVEWRDPGKTNRRYLLTCIAFIILAVISFAFDVYKIFCHPRSWVQPHSLWHLFSGCSAFYFYMYIRSEKNKI